MSPNISTEKIAGKLDVDRLTAFPHLKNLGYTLKPDLWFPHITELNKLKRISTAIFLLARKQTEPFFGIKFKWRLLQHNYQPKP